MIVPRTANRSPAICPVVPSLILTEFGRMAIDPPTFSIRTLGSSGARATSSNRMAPRMSPIEPSGNAPTCRLPSILPTGFSFVSVPAAPGARRASADVTAPSIWNLSTLRSRESWVAPRATGTIPEIERTPPCRRAVTFSILTGPASVMMSRPRASAKSTGNCCGQRLTPPRSTVMSTRGPGSSPFLRLMATARSADPSATRLLNSSREAPSSAWLTRSSSMRPRASTSTS